MIDADHTNLAVDEAATVAGMSLENLQALLLGPLTPQQHGHVSVRQTLTAVIMASLPAIAVEDAIAISVDAARMAQPNGERVLLVAWPDGKPVAVWRDALTPFDQQPRRPFLIVPADQQLTALLDRIAEHRAAKQRPN